MTIAPAISILLSLEWDAVAHTKTEQAWTLTYNLELIKSSGLQSLY